jgi:probable rRNA maturation factor
MPATDPPLLLHRAGRGLDRRWLRGFAERLLREVAGGRSFTCLVADDRRLLALNRRFLGRDYPADVLSFPSASPSGDLGDVAISADRARAQARALGHPVEREIGVLLLHGLLHLMGMDHERDGGRMRRAEKRWRARLGLPVALTERTAGVRR